MKLFAHRGMSAQAPENATTAFQMAVEAGVDGIELDVRMAADQAIVIHDATLERTTNGHGDVATMSQPIWQALDAGDGQPPPSLGDVMDMVAGQCCINIEIKHISAVKAVAKLVVEACASGQFLPNQLLVSSFDHHALMAFRSLAKGHPIAPLIGAKHLDYAACAEPMQAQAIHSFVETTDQAFVDDAHARGMEVGVYTVTTAQELERMYRLGVDYVFVNDIPWARVLMSELTQG